MQGVTAVVKELCVRFPMVDYHNDRMLLAVGMPLVPASRQDTARGQVIGPSHSAGDTHRELVAVYDMQSGTKQHSLHVR